MAAPRGVLLVAMTAKHLADKKAHVTVDCWAAL